MSLFAAASLAAVGASDVLELMQVGVHCEAVESLAAEQAEFWRHEGKALHKVATTVNASALGVAEDVDEFLRNQMNPDNTCHAKLYRYQNMLNHLHDDVNLVYSKEKTLVETIQAEEAIVSDLNARIKRALEDAAAKKKQCAETKAEACAQAQTYAGELEELKQIGHSPEHPLALFQATMRRARRTGVAAGLGSSARATLHARRLKASHREYKTCLAETPGAVASLLQLSQEPEEFQASNQQVSEHKFDATVTFGEKECERERERLEKAWREAYMSIEDLLETNTAACEDDSCENAVDAELQTTLPPMHEEQSERIKTIREAQHELVKVRAEMEALEPTLKKVEIATADAQEQCGTLEKGSEYLEEVRDLIKGMKRCPGLAGAAFTIPEFQRTVTVTTLDIMGESVADTDAKLDAACKDAAAEHDREATRAATQTELRGRLIDGIPETNDFQMSLYGICPGCRGVSYQGSADGHLRRCYKPQATVNVKGESKDCQENLGHAVCVIDRSLAERGMGNVDLTFFFGTELPAGEEGILDTGAGFKSHGGLSFGWDCNGDANVDYSSGRRNLGRGGGLGLNHFDRSNTCKNGGEYLPVHWNVLLPSGEYDVTVNFPEYYHQGCTVEGENWCGPETNNKACVVSKKVTVTDGKFTLQGFGHDSGECHSVAKVVIKKYRASGSKTTHVPRALFPLRGFVPFPLGFPPMGSPGGVPPPLCPPPRGFPVWPIRTYWWARPRSGGGLPFCGQGGDQEVASFWLKCSGAEPAGV
eukprot:CAMPEP_0204397012 /NCGR_PEP_ID=MMETSP0470-20130426/1855_1 /ASSEMBLY_ACC=CAM_ASM_000385 /TAXON_ID=2969 /ORGANISM="Oxyrrhis marina" /LENGTH=763 /DNA_ID=CAMNT_0051391371 /DNA_START=59 /DNA_END=2348 /DNA_ORIENTATION=+